MGYFECDDRPCLVCHMINSLSCTFFQDYNNLHNYCPDNLSYLEYKYEQSTIVSR